MRDINGTLVIEPIERVKKRGYFSITHIYTIENLEKSRLKIEEH